MEKFSKIKCNQNARISSRFFPSAEKEDRQTDTATPLFVCINFFKRNKNTCTQPSYTNQYQVMAWERSCILGREQSAYLVK